LRGVSIRLLVVEGDKRPISMPHLATLVGNRESRQKRTGLHSGLPRIPQIRGVRLACSRGPVG